MKKNLIIFGIGETARLAYEYFTHDSKYKVIAFVVDDLFKKDSFFMGLDISTTTELTIKFSPEEFEIFIAIGSGKLNYQRKESFLKIKSLGYKMASYVSSKAFIWHDVLIGENCFILENNVLQSGVKIGDNVTLWSGNHIGHLSSIESHTFISSHVVISGNCTIGENSFIGVNACCADNIKIARDNFIGMGAVINKSTEEDSIYIGNPMIKRELSAKKFCKV
jgi:sugar O-acyltransferase (sialic acid O-acetyltransferase NeuD family)